MSADAAAAAATPEYHYPTVAVVDDADKDKGYPGHVTPEQEAQLFQLRSMLEAEGYTKRLDTLTMLRFLRARKFDVNAAKQMFVDCEAWRKKTMLDDLVPIWTYPEREQMFEFYPQFYHKTDKDGRPVYIEQFGGIDLTAMRKITTDERMLDNLAVEYERCADPRFPACSRKFGHLVETCCTIMDMKKVSLRTAPQVYDYIQRASTISQNYYPERLGKLYIINAPWGFSAIWSIVKGWLDPVTVKKINILGGSFQKDLLAQIPAENLPEEYGGTCKCPSKDPEKPNESGCAHSDAGPWKDEEPMYNDETKKDIQPWWWPKPVKEQALQNLKGTSKEPPVVNTGGVSEGAAEQQTATVSA